MSWWGPVYQGSASTDVQAWTQFHHIPFVTRQPESTASQWTNTPDVMVPNYDDGLYAMPMYGAFVLKLFWKHVNGTVRACQFDDIPLNGYTSYTLSFNLWTGAQNTS